MCQDTWVIQRSSSPYISRWFRIFHPPITPIILTLCLEVSKDQDVQEGDTQEIHFLEVRLLLFDFVRGGTLMLRGGQSRDGVGSYAREQSHDGSDAGDGRELDSSLGGAGRMLRAPVSKGDICRRCRGKCAARSGARPAIGAAASFGAVPSKARIGKGKRGSPAAA